MKTSWKITGTMLAAITVVLTVVACEKSKMNQPADTGKATDASNKKAIQQPIILESEKAGYKFYSPCMNYTGKLAKNGGC